VGTEGAGAVAGEGAAAGAGAAAGVRKQQGPEQQQGQQQEQEQKQGREKQRGEEQQQEQGSSCCRGGRSDSSGSRTTLNTMILKNSALSINDINTQHNPQDIVLLCWAP
jgi:hypothetical protein